MENSEQNTQMPPMENKPPVVNVTQKQSGQGALFGSIIIILLIVVGAIFVIKNTRNTMTDSTNDQQMTAESQDEVMDTNTYVETQSSVSGSDELAEIGTEIDATNINSVDYGVDEEFK
jgi:uncharacterized protein HemX